MNLNLSQIILLGLVQALTEWLPLSSKTISTLVYMEFFGYDSSTVISALLFLHFGTLLAATVYFRTHIRHLLKAFISNPFSLKANSESKIGFLFSSLVMTGLVGIPLLLAQKLALPLLDGNSIYILMGAGLIVTGFLLSSKKAMADRSAENATWKDGILVGALQGLSVLPGVSRAGATTAALVWRRFNPESAFQLSFLLSIPTIFAAEILFWGFQNGNFASLPIHDGVLLAASSFFFGYLTIDMLIKIAQKLNLAWLAFSFGIMMLLFGLWGLS
ncbi:MAG: undecaprenyl-diphosphate phosphatase [Candidatus Anstonellaceae archaeon]